jgi:hypothetical protein
MGVIVSFKSTLKRSAAKFTVSTLVKHTFPPHWTYIIYIRTWTPLVNKYSSKNVSLTVRQKCDSWVNLGSRLKNATGYRRFLPKRKIKMTEFNQTGTVFLVSESKVGVCSPNSRQPGSSAHTSAVLLSRSPHISCHPWLLLVRQPALHTCLAHCIDPTGPSNPSTPSNSYHYHYRCYPNHTTHSTPVIDIFTPPIRLAVMWYGHCSSFFSVSLLPSVCRTRAEHTPSVTARCCEVSRPATVTSDTRVWICPRRARSGHEALWISYSSWYLLNQTPLWPAVC